MKPTITFEQFKARILQTVVDAKKFGEPEDVFLKYVAINNAEQILECYDEVGMMEALLSGGIRGIDKTNMWDDAMAAYDDYRVNCQRDDEENGKYELDNYIEGLKDWMESKG